MDGLRLALGDQDVIVRYNVVGCLDLPSNHPDGPAVEIESVEDDMGQDVDLTFMQDRVVRWACLDDARAGEQRAHDERAISSYEDRFGDAKGWWY